MDFSIASLLANFSDEKLVAPKILEKKLGCQDKSSLRKFQIALDALEKIGILVKERGKYRRVYEEGIVEAKLRCSSKGFCFAIQDAENSEDIYIRECHLSTAWNGDRVLVKVIKDGSRRRSPEGEVKLVLERANPSVLARLKQISTAEGKTIYKAIPLDDRLLFEIDVEPESNDLSQAIDYLVHVEVIRYPLGYYPPLGRVAQILGSDAEEANDLDIVCCKHDLPRSFNELIEKEAKALPKILRKADLKNRLDLRKVLTLTFIKDPANPTIEHAFSLETRAAGKWRLGIHIADVAYYVPSDSSLDREAKKRGTAVFLGDIFIPLFPENIYSNRCCFIPGEDRLAISVLITLNSSGQVIEYEIQPSVIEVNHQLTCQEAAAILAKEEDSALSPVIEQLQSICQGVQRLRQHRGAIELNLPPTQYGSGVRTGFDDEGALGLLLSSPKASVEAIVREFILLANQVIASQLHALSVPALYRVQPTPDIEEVQEFIKLASNLGASLQLESEEEVRPQDYQRFKEQFAGTSNERVLTYLLQETLRPAAYSTSPGPHFGLSLGTGDVDRPYTHACSPVNRYADLMMQRVLHTVFEYGRDRRTTRVKESVNLRHSNAKGQIHWNVLAPELQTEIEENLSGMVSHLIDREKIAQEAEEDLVGLKKAAAMKERTGETFSGLITGVQSYGFFVEIEELMVEGLVHVSSLKDDWYEYRSRQQTLVGRKNRKQYRLGDRVEVQVKSVDYYRQQIDLVAVSGGSMVDSNDLDDFDSHW